MQIRKDILILLINSIKIGIEDGSINEEINPVEIAVLIKSMTENNLNMSPDLVKSFEKEDIDNKKFFSDTNNLINNLLKSKN